MGDSVLALPTWLVAVSVTLLAVTTLAVIVLAQLWMAAHDALDNEIERRHASELELNRYRRGVPAAEAQCSRDVTDDDPPEAA